VWGTGHIDSKRAFLFRPGDCRVLTLNSNRLRRRSSRPATKEAGHEQRPGRRLRDVRDAGDAQVEAAASDSEIYRELLPLLK
jgi:hypothetical protein